MAMQKTAEVITIDSDSSDDFECTTPKRPRLKSPDKSSSSTHEALKKLDTLKEISTFNETHREVKIKSVNSIKTDSITIIIDDVAKAEPKHSISNISISSSVVVIDGNDEDSLEVSVVPKENISNDCTVILDDPSEESEVSQTIAEDLNTSGEATIIPDEKPEEREKPAEREKPEGGKSEEAEKLEEEGEKLEEEGEKSDEGEKPEEGGKSEESEKPEEGEKPEEDEKAEIYDRPSTSKASETHKILDQFLEACTNSIKGSKYESRLLTKFSKMRKHFNDCDNLHDEPNFKRMLEDHLKTAKFSAPDAVVSFQRIYAYLLDNINGASIEIPEGNLEKIKKLEKACKLLVKKLQQLEEAEVDFDDESDSTYIQIDRYSQRLSKVYSKYCQLIKKSPHAGRLLYEKIRFVSSKYDEINRAITKSYRHNKFPTYFDIEKCIRDSTTKHNLPLSEGDIKEESKHCFTKLGNLLQLRRKKELYEVHCSFITLNEDPANIDPELKVKLQESLKEGQNKMKEVVEKFVKLQDNEVAVDVSEDSDDSHYKSSDSEH